MRRSGLSAKIAVSAALIATCFGSTAAVAAARPAPVASLSPLVALSTFGSDFSRAALCGTATSAAATGSASAFAATSSTTAQPAPQAGCVLPVTDLPAALPQSAAIPASYNLPWALLGAVGLIGALTLAALLHNDDDDSQFIPVSPS